MLEALGSNRSAQIYRMFLVTEEGRERLIAFVKEYTRKVEEENAQSPEGEWKEPIPSPEFVPITSYDLRSSRKEEHKSYYRH